MIFSFILFLLLFVAVGIASYRYSQPTVQDYLLASKNIKPWLAGFSFFATENSGFMFMGYIGLVYTYGLSALWILIAWYLGEVTVLWRAAYIIRQQTEKAQPETYSELLAGWTGQEYKWVRILSALIIVMFLCFYAAAQLSAGGKALHALAGWDLNLSATIGFALVLIYCLAGGIRATIWTDAIQAIVMFGSLLMIVAFGLHGVGGLGGLSGQLSAINPDLMNMMAGSYKFGLLAYVLGWFFAGTGIMGASHVIVRFMVVENAAGAKKAVLYYIFFVTALSALCTIAGLCARVLIPELSEGGDAELALPLFSAQFLPEILSGLFLAGLFAAAMSTADSQILSSSAALTRDLTPRYKDKYLWTKAGTVLVALLALAVAISGDKSVFKLATFGWSIMGAGMGPLLFIYTLGKKPTQLHALLMMIGGVAVSLAWDFAGLSDAVYNVMPGILAGLLIYVMLAPFLKVSATKQS